MCLNTQAKIFWPIFSVAYITALVWGCRGGGRAEGSGATQAQGVHAQVSQDAGEDHPGSDPGEDHRVEHRPTVGEVRPVDASYPEALYR